MFLLVVILLATSLLAGCQNGRVKELEAQNQELQSKLSEAEIKVAELEPKNSELEATVSELQGQVTDKNTIIGGLEKERDELSLTKISLEKEVGVLKALIANLQAQLASGHPDLEGLGPKEGVAASINIADFFQELKDEEYDVAERYLTSEFAVEMLIAGGLKNFWEEEAQDRELIKTGVWGSLEVPGEYRVENVEQSGSRVEIGFAGGSQEEYFFISRLIEGVWKIEKIIKQS